MYSIIYCWIFYGFELWRWFSESVIFGRYIYISWCPIGFSTILTHELGKAVAPQELTQKRQQLEQQLLARQPAEKRREAASQAIGTAPKGWRFLRHLKRIWHEGKPRDLSGRENQYNIYITHGTHPILGLCKTQQVSSRYFAARRSWQESRRCWRFARKITAGLRRSMARRSCARNGDIWGFPKIGVLPNPF